MRLRSGKTINNYPEDETKVVLLEHFTDTELVIEHDPMEVCTEIEAWYSKVWSRYTILLNA